MHKYVWRFVAVCICGCLLASVVRAKVWLLPDYQSSQFYSRRINGGNNHQSDNPVCSDYGMYTASQITAGMSCASSTMIKNLKCFGDCSCSSVYQYTSSSCRSAGKIPSGSSCMGKYRECICDTSTYPHTSSSCAYTLSGASCYDKYGYHYNSCVNPCAAYASYTNVSSCSYGCEDVVSTCTSKCRKCYADNCRNRTAVSTPYGCEEYFSDCPSKCKKAYTDNCHNRADNETKLGCEKYWSDCPSKCQTGKTCVKSFPAGYAASVTCSEAGQTKDAYASCGETRYKCVCEKAEQSCRPGTSLVNICTNDAGNKVGDCVDCRDPESPNNPCKGFALCEGDKVGDGKTCDCGGLTYHERCLVPEKCLQNVAYDDTPLGKCSTAFPENHGSWWNSHGYYPAGVKCTRQDGIKLYCNGYCNDTSLDLAGNMPPCAGKKGCPDNKGTGLCECGGKKYFDECSEKCDQDTPYDDTPLGKCSTAFPENHGSWWNSHGYYPAGVKCTRQDGIKLYCNGYCNDTSLDLAGNMPPCAGKKGCPDNKGTGLCECGGKKYFDECSEKCDQDTPYDDTPLGKCSTAFPENHGSWWNSHGYYPAGVKCTRQDGIKLYCNGYCNDTSLDLAGNMPPCAGKKECENGLYALGELCECGGKMYGDSCGTVCNYEDTPERCAAQGKSFSRKCADSSGNLFGECI